MSAIMELTDYQIFTIYFWPRVKDGGKDPNGRKLDLKIREVLNLQAVKAEFFMTGQMMKIPYEQLQKQWSSVWGDRDV